MADPTINLDEIQKEVANLSPDAMKEELLKYRVRQKKQQKKNQGSDTQKKYQLKQREKMKLMKAKAIELGLWDEINDQAEQTAEKELAEETVETE